MRLVDIPESTIINISIVTPQKNIELSSTVEHLSDYEKKMLNKNFVNKNIYYVPLKLIVENDKTVGFPTDEGYFYSVGCSINEKYYSWNNVLIKTAKLNGKLYHLVLSSLDVPSTNRRNAYRLWIGEKINLSIGLGKELKTAILKDLSAIGMGIITNENTDLSVGKTLHVKYTDLDGVNFNLTGKIVNITEIGINKFLIGCQFLNRSEAINKYVSQKQIERAKAKKH